MPAASVDTAEVVDEGRTEGMRKPSFSRSSSGSTGRCRTRSLPASSRGNVRVVEPPAVENGSSIVTIVGRDFAVDGVPVDYGPIAAIDGTLTGTLASGDLIDNRFCHNGSNGFCSGGTANGLITLVPEPDQALLFAAALLSLAAVRARA